MCEGFLPLGIDRHDVEVQRRSGWHRQHLIRLRILIPSYLVLQDAEFR